MPGLLGLERYRTRALKCHMFAITTANRMDTPYRFNPRAKPSRIRERSPMKKRKGFKGGKGVLSKKNKKPSVTRPNPSASLS